MTDTAKLEREVETLKGALNLLRESKKSQRAVIERHEAVIAAQRRRVLELEQELAQLRNGGAVH